MSIQNVTASVNGGITQWWRRIVVHALAGKLAHGLSRHSRDEEKRDDCLESIQLASTNSATHTSHMLTFSRNGVAGRGQSGERAHTRYRGTAEPSASGLFFAPPRSTRWR